MLDGNVITETIWIEPYWNVNDRCLYPCFTKTRIWIEPYWNVNADYQSLPANYTDIWIEPYWNVNQGGTNGYIDTH